MKTPDTLTESLAMFFDQLPPEMHTEDSIRFLIQSSFYHGVQTMLVIAGKALAKTKETNDPAHFNNTMNGLIAEVKGECARMMRETARGQFEN